MNSRAPGITFGFTRVNSILERNKRAVGETFVGREQCARGMPCRVSLMHFNGNITHAIRGKLFLNTYVPSVPLIFLQLILQRVAEMTGKSELH